MIDIPADTSFLAAPRYAETRALIQHLDDVLQRHDVQPRRRIQTALDWMLRAHYHQPDRSDGPYVNHPLTVALHVVEEFEQRDADLIMAALLHDTVEDQADAVVALADNPAVPPSRRKSAAVTAVSTHFGERVAAIVSSLTNPDFGAMQAEYAANGRSVTRYQLYHDHVAAIFEQDADAFVIKLADLWQNAGTLDTVPDLQQQRHLRRKYGPVLSLSVERLTRLEDPDHPLFARRKEIVLALTEIADAC